MNMMPSQSQLFSSFRLRGLELPNRIVVSPMCQYSAEDGSATDWHMMHLGTLAQSGAGLLIFEATGVEPEGRITHACLGLYSDANEAGLEAGGRRLPPLRPGQARHAARPRRPQGLIEGAVGGERA